MRRTYSLFWRGQQHLMAPGSFSLGRSPTCSLVLDDSRVSRVHAVIHVGVADAVLHDSRSQNGTRVNRVACDGPITLHHGDRIGIGGTELVLHATSPDRQAVSRDRTMPEEQATAVHAAFAARDSETQLACLTGRELEVLQLLACGHTQREIAARLGVSVKTVEGYRARISDKLGMRSRAELVRLALRAGLLRA